MLRSNSKQSGKCVESVLKKKKKGCGGKDLQKRKVLGKLIIISMTVNIIRFYS